MEAPPPTPPLRYRFPKSARLGGRLRFAAVRESGLKEARGPLVIRAIPNDQNHLRLGISIGRHVGIAVKRNRIKRLLRESLRLLQHDLPTGYDVVVSVKAHAPMILADYQRILSACITKLHSAWTLRGKP